MSGARREERRHRRAMTVGIAVSAAAHAAVLGLARLDVPAASGPAADASWTEARAERLTERPLEVVRIREAAAPEPSAARSAPPPRVAVPAALAAALPTPRLLLAKVEVKEEAPPPVAAFPSVEDLLIQRGPNPKALRPIDDRPIEVLAAIARSQARRGGGIRIGGGGGACE